MKTKEEVRKLTEEYEIYNNKLQELSIDELKQVSGGNYNGPYRFELDQKVREIKGFQRIGKIMKYDGMADREAYVVWFDGDEYGHWGNYHCYAEELEAI